MHRFARRTLFSLALTLAALGASASPGGAGGIIVGIQRPDWSPEFLPAIGADLGIEHAGGYGYGVAKDGFIVGGFGMALLDRGLLGDTEAPPQHLAGGVGGLIIGQRLIDGGRIVLDLGTRLGLGGIGYYDGGWRGWAVAYAEPYAELVVAIAPWMALSVQAGYRFMGNFAPGILFEELFLRSPVLGFAISWGKY